MLIDNLSFTYPKSDKLLLKNININFEKKLINVVIGMNGAGKTTLFDILIGQYKPLEGKIVNLPFSKDILYHVQGAYISFLIKGKDYIRLIYKLTNKKFYSNCEQNMQEIGFDNLREIELFKDLWDKKIGQMSVGERRWLYVTTLSQIKKNLYIFDEPTAGVDPSSRIKIYKRLENIIINQDSTLIVSTHHLHELRNIKCKIFLMDEGQIKFQGSFMNFLKNASTDNPDEAFDYYVNREYVKW